MRSSLLLLFLLPSLAAAQTATLTLGFASNQTTSNEGKTFTVGANECDNEALVTWALATEVCDQLTIWVQNFDVPCALAPPPNSLTIEDLSITEVANIPAPSGSTGVLHGRTARVAIDELLDTVAPTTGTRNACGADVQETRSFRMCGYTKSPTGTVTACGSSQDLKSTPSDLKLVYDHEKPAAPAPKVTGGDKKLVVRFTDAADIDSVSIELREETTQFRVVATGDPIEEFELKGLTNGTTYFVRATQTDLAGNVSDASPEVSGTPVEIQDFWEYYQGAGGTDGGGCGVAGGAGLSLGAALAVVGLWLASRRRAS
jgi:hypothetical protein